MYQFSPKYKNLPAQKIWEFIQNGLSNDVIIKSIRDKVPYNINYVTEEAISFSATSRNGGEADIISKVDFIKVVSLLLKEQVVNTSASKELFRGTKIYKKRSPLFALLLSSAVIERLG